MKRNRRGTTTGFAAAGVALVLSAAGFFTASGGTSPLHSPAAAQQAFLKDWNDWRNERLAGLRSETGWLSLVGLFWLEPGENRFGSDPSNAIALTSAGIPGKAGSFVLKDGRVRLEPAPGSGITKNGAPATAGEIASDENGKPDVLKLGSVTMTIIKRGDKLGVRAKDPNAATRRDFRGIETFPPDPAWRIEAKYTPYAEPKTLNIPTVLGTVEPMKAPGRVTFRIPGAKAGEQGPEVSLEPVLEGDDATELFFIFRDTTSRKETYPPGRFLYTDLPKDGRVIIDFNRAYNPPCAFTPFATCPLPPKGNVLLVRIPAGEKNYEGGHEMHPD
jgi:uncharacterized protein (DUF1684 family)